MSTATAVRWPSESVDLTLRRVAVVVAVVWLVVEASTVVEVGPASFRAPWLAVGSIVLALAGCLWVSRSARVDPRVMVVGVGVATVTDSLLADPRSSSAGGYVVYWLPSLLAMTTSFLLPARVARIVCAVVPIGFGALVLVRTLRLADASASWMSALMTMSYALTAGLAALSIAQALRKVAAAADEAASASATERRRELATRLELAQANELAARLHDTVINTLSAVVTRAPSLDPELVRGDCARSLAVAREVMAREVMARDVTTRDVTTRDAVSFGSTAVGPGSVEDEVRQALDWNSTTSPPAYPQVTLVGVSHQELVHQLLRQPAPVAAAMAGGVREALVNAGKHSGRTGCRVQVDTGPVLRVAVVDDGRGFDGQLVPGRGLARSVFERSASAGVDVDLHTAPGDGTRVTFAYDGRRLASGEQTAVADRTASRDATDLLASVSGPFAVRLAYCILAMCVGASVISTGGIPTLSSGVALGLLLVAVPLGAVMARRAPNSGGVGGERALRAVGAIAMVCVVAPVVALPGLHSPGCARVGPLWWGSDGALVPPYEVARQDGLLGPSTGREDA